MTIALLLAALTIPAMEGDRLHPGTTCYAILQGDRTIGTTTQSITATRAKGKPAWDITVHQTLSNGRFDMRDHFIVERTTLLPIAMDSQRSVDRQAPGWHRITLSYGETRITGSKETAAGTSSIDVPLTGPVWDGNLWGLTFAALPLHAGGSYRLPFWQYDKGFGTFTVHVTRKQPGDKVTGTPGAWLLDAGDDPAHLMRYIIGKHPRREIGYNAGAHAQQIAAVCKG